MDFDWFRMNSENGVMLFSELCNGLCLTQKSGISW